MRISERPELGVMMTFELCKSMPMHGWFWYKEGYAPQIVEWLVREQGIGRGAGDGKPWVGNRKPDSGCRKQDAGKREPDAGRLKPDAGTPVKGVILDPFCGVGTTLLSAKGLGFDSIGVDASPLASFISKVKCDDYSEEDITQVESFLARMKDIRPDERGPRERWDFELFDTRAAFPRRNHLEILAIRRALEEEEPKARDLLLLALLSSLPQASIILKDGGVLKIRKDKRAMPIREVMRRKARSMVADLRASPVKGPMPSVFLGDARRMDLPDSSVDAVITSPPYLNNIDYSKIYGLELSLLSMSKASASEMRLRAVRSFIKTGDGRPETDLPPEVGDIGSRIPIIGTYFKDMEGAMEEMFRLLAPGGVADIIVSNSVIHETHVLVDEVLAEMGERIGFAESEIIVGAERIADVRPHKVKTRESVVVLRK